MGRPGGNRSRSVPLPRGRVVSDVEASWRQKGIALSSGWLILYLGIGPDVLSVLLSIAGQALSEFGRNLYSAGGPSYLFRQAILGFCDLFPYRRSNVRAAWDTIKQWERRGPVELTAPCPESVAYALVSLCLLWEWSRLAAYISFCFLRMLRGIECRLLRRADISLPSDRNGRRPSRIYIRVLDPKMSRRGAAVEHVYVECLWAVFFLEKLIGGLLPGTVIFPFTPDALKRRWERLLVSLGIPACRLYLNSLRGGGTVFVFEESENIQTVMWKGRKSE